MGKQKSMEKKFYRVPSPGALKNLDRIWEYYLPPFRIAPHVFSVGGNNDVAVYLLDTGEGLILIDTGMSELLYLIVDSIWRLGFDPRDIRKILISHGHGDHYNGARQLKELSGAEIYMSRVDEAFYKAHPVRGGAFRWAEVPFTVDHYFEDVPEIRMGRFDIRTRMTPGHTPGTISFFFEDTDDVTGETFRVGMHGGAGTNQMAPDYLKELGLPEAMAHTFVRDCNEMKELDIDICLPSHLNQINLAANIPKDRRDYRPFVGKEIWKDFLTERAGVVKGFYPEVYGK